MNSLLTMYHYADLSIGFVSTSKKFDGISSLAYNKIPPPHESRSNLYGLLKPPIRKLLRTKLSSIFVSEIIRTLMFPLT